MSSEKEYVCIEQEQLGNHGRKIAELEAEINFKEKRIDDLYSKIEKMEQKIDKLNENVNQLLIQSRQGDTDLELRLKAIETELAIQKQNSIDNHNRLSSILAVVGVGLTIITILINVYFNIIH